MNLRIILTALATTAASVLWMGVATASATNVEAPAGTIYTGIVAAEAEGHVVLDNPIATIECASKVEGEVESHGEGVTAKGNLSALSFTGCTNEWHVTVVSAGSLEVHYTSGSNGTLRSSGATVEATRFGITCRYSTSNTEVGTVTGGSPATLDINAKIPFHSGSIFCGSGATNWTGSYKVTSPAELLVNQGAAVPSLEIATADKFDEKKAVRVVKLEDKNGALLPYTVDSIDVVNEGGTWTLEEAKNCEKKGVAAKGLICEVKIGCGAGPGKARIRVFMSWPGNFLLRPTPVTCG